MHCKKIFTVACLLAGGAFGQSAEDGLRSKITSVRFPPLSKQARIQGDVHLYVNSGEVTLLSGHPLLAPAAVASAKAFGSILGSTDTNVTYHFVLVDTAKQVPTRVTVKRGNALERAIFRMFGLKTEKVALYHLCQVGNPPANDLKFSDTTIEIWIYGGIGCPQFNSTILVARR